MYYAIHTFFDILKRYDGLSTATSASKLIISNKVNRIEIVGRIESNLT